MRVNPYTPVADTEQGQEALHPTVNGAAIDGEATLGEPLDHIGVAQAVANVPAYSEGDDIIGETVMRERTC